MDVRPTRGTQVRKGGFDGIVGPEEVYVDDCLECVGGEAGYGCEAGI